ncbi:hypothetical protein [Roseibaca sp. Y0-43]|uniref:hypothetical protein n=1 Tax=Roseibaca sp. Y0-43 TaxID=2816854 RepID=UPI001D0CA838|nr:hypothetical protein [Roseibaca sp. Y0-43]MCC1480174.1 hypothetical protein [Roseibaca sp. Y0-43]
MSMTPRLKASLAVLAIAGLGACTMNPMARPMPVIPAPSAGTAPAPAAGMAGAEAACTAAGRERGLDVLGVVSTRDVTGASGAPERDVMLRVARSGTQLEVRCNYQPDTGTARIMLI